MFKVLVAGSREFDDYAILAATLDRVLAGRSDAVILSGGARGADRLGERYAKERGLAVERHLPDWRRHGRGAGHIRNGAMVAAADAAVFFWDGASKGTADGIRKAQARGIPVEVIRWGQTPGGIGPVRGADSPGRERRPGGRLVCCVA